MAGTRPGKWSVGLWLAAIAAVAVALHWGWVRAWWVYPDLSERERAGTFDKALVAKRGVSARLETGGMTILARSDIAQVGASRCVRNSECSQAVYRTRRWSVGCAYVSVTFHCGYAVTTTDGSAASALVTLDSNRNYSPGVSVPGSPEPLEVSTFLHFDDVDDKLCRFGFGCQPAKVAQPDAQSGAQPSAAPSLGPAACTGIRADVAGAGETCLDPRDPARRDFRDCKDDFCGPAMVALPKGRGLRGSSAADIARLRMDDPKAFAESFKGETPQREVAIGYQLAVGKFEVTFEEWDACLADGGCRRRPEDPSNRARGERPVIHVSWIETSEEFLPWLNRRLGLSGANAYRLLTEAEWEYAARAGTSTRYAFGDIISTAQANFRGPNVVTVGSFAPNGFGLHDMHGNVAEWVQDCFENGYDRAPIDGAAYQPAKCSSRRHRGGSWHDLPTHIRSAHRGLSDPKDRSGKGFRVARTLAAR